MTLIEFSEWLSGTPFSQVIQSTMWMIPGLQTVHILALAVLFASAMVMALRVFGRGLAMEKVASVATRFSRPIWLALLLLALSGALLITAEPGRTLGNPAFNLKMLCLVAVVLVTLVLQSHLRRDRPPGALQAVLAVVSIGLWTTIIVAGRLIAYTEATY
ncbi:MAG: hypothetical protein RL026_203 [Pseudomonadota bacterium]|jgi:cytochrome bd-type quinol oxidase subunit 2